MPTVLLTGIAGFIGFHLAGRLAREGHSVLGIDNLNNYYDPDLKLARLKELGISPGSIRDHTEIPSRIHPELRFLKMDLSDRSQAERFFRNENFPLVIHLAAQPGARASLTHPYSYIDNNILGFINLLEGCRHMHTDHLLYASSSSVYGGNTKQPYAEDDRVDTPVSLYAATKRSNELMAYTYSHLFGIPVTGLRFFTVYGPWGRPDMAYYKFVKAIVENRPVDVYNEGNLERDFTYVDDIIQGILNILKRKPSGTPPYQLFNIGHSEPVNLLRFIEVIEGALGKKAIKRFLPMQAGDVLSTFADTRRLEQFSGYKPTTSIEVGIGEFTRWYLRYHALNE
ncbi:MAG TPA: NAD-dependent epimerase/dehydratase family protein [Bacteroidales bacterium]|nr:NAD-dependent epimerase/dehydratase family protein [Bacteroidales bacterium]HRZ22252.1 NAD-dependent epimerase/dehydratase family protein [Bacteroidales bacterium]